MTDNITDVYGPHTLHLSPGWWYKKFLLRFQPLVVHDREEGIVIYKTWNTTMYVFGVVKKPTQFEKSEES